MRIIHHPPHHAQLNAVARVLCAFVAHLHGESSKGFDPRDCARLVLLAGVDLGTLITPEGDELLAELLAHAKRVDADRRQMGGAA